MTMLAVRTYLMVYAGVFSAALVLSLTRLAAWFTVMAVRVMCKVKKSKKTWRSVK